MHRYKISQKSKVRVTLAHKQDFNINPDSQLIVKRKDISSVQPYKTRHLLRNNQSSQNDYLVC